MKKEGTHSSSSDNTWNGKEGITTQIERLTAGFTVVSSSLGQHSNEGRPKPVSPLLLLDC